MKIGFGLFTSRGRLRLRVIELFSGGSRARLAHELQSAYWHERARSGFPLGRELATSSECGSSPQFQLLVVPAIVIDHHDIGLRASRRMQKQTFQLPPEKRLKFRMRAGTNSPARIMPEFLLPSLISPYRNQ